MAVRNPGPLLTSDLYAEHDDVPREFKAKFGIRRTEQQQPNEVLVDLLANTRISSTIVQERTDERKKTNVDFIGDWTIPLLAKKFIPTTGQVATVTRNLTVENTPFFATALTEEAEQHNLGIGKNDQTVVTVPAVFGGELYKRERQNPIPLVFQNLLPEFEFDQTVAGTAGFPILLLGDVERSEAQQTVFRKRVTHRYNDTSQLPLIPLLISDSSTNRFKQVETRDRLLELDSRFPVAPTAIQDVSFEKLGNGLAVETRTHVPSLFIEQLFETRRPDVTPEKFKALIPVLTDENLVQGTASPPILTTGQFEASKKQENVFVYRDRVVSRNLNALPTTITGSRTNQFKQVETVAEILEVDTTIPFLPTSLLNVTFTKLGDGTAVEERVSVPSLFIQQTFEFSRPDPAPDWVKEILPLTTDEHLVAGVVPRPVLMDFGTYSLSNKQENVFVYRTRETSRDLSQLPRSITESRTNQFKQVETITKIIDLDTVIPSVPTATLDVKFVKLGDGTAVQERTAVPSIFTGQTFEVSRPDLTPEWAKQLLPTKIDEHLVVGTASLPTLGSGQYSISQKQENVFTFRSRVQSRDLGTLPKTLISSQTNRFKQVETITKILDLDNGPNLTPSALVDVIYTRLGDGTAVEEQTSIPSVFANDSYVFDFPDMVPIEFRNLVPLNTVEKTLSGVVSQNPLPPPAGEILISSRDDQQTLFTHRQTIKSRDITVLPITHFDQESTEQYGGGQITVTRTLASTPPTFDRGLLVIDCKVQTLGSSLHQKETRTLNGSAWPTLITKKWDEEMQVMVTEETQVVDNSYVPTATTVGSYFVEDVRSIDDQRSLRVKITKQPTALNVATALTTEDTRPYNFPGWLVFFGNGFWVRGSHVVGVQHTIKTFWMSSGTKPDLNALGLVNPIYMDDPLISSLNNTNIIEQAGPCLHDQIVSFGITFLATTPSTSTYLNTWVGTSKYISAEVTKTDIPFLWKIVATSVVMK